MELHEEVGGAARMCSVAVSSALCANAGSPTARARVCVPTFPSCVTSEVSPGKFCPDEEQELSDAV